jgi:MoxR-like ATPase
MAEQAARALGLSFHPVSCHEMMTRTDLFGYRDANGTDHRTPLWEAYENGGVVLLDEVDNGNPNLLAALNSAMSNGHCVFGSGTVVERHPDFRVVATANTAGLGPEAGYIGRNGVDLATRDRFVTLPVPIDPTLEAVLAAVALGDEQSAEDAEAMSFNAVVEALRARARTAVTTEATVATITSVIDRVRRAVESRFAGTVVSPRATLHVASMVRRGFTIEEAIGRKLVGLSDEEVSSVLL